MAYGVWAWGFGIKLSDLDSKRLVAVGMRIMRLHQNLGPVNPKPQNQQA